MPNSIEIIRGRFATFVKSFFNKYTKVFYVCAFYRFKFVGLGTNDLYLHFANLHKIAVLFYDVDFCALLVIVRLI